MKELIGSILFVALLLASASLALAKGGPAKLAISGPALKGVVEVTDPQLLDGLGEVSLDYRSGSIAAPKVGEGYALTVFEKEGEQFRPYDRWRYHINPTGAAGYIFYIGAGEFGNVSNNDGKWFCAAPGADASLRRLLRSLGVSVTDPSANNSEKMTIKGPGVKNEVELNSSELDPQQLGYYGWGRMAVPQVGAGYELTRYVKNCTGEYIADFRMHYYPGSAGKPGYIYQGDGDEYSLSRADNWFFTAPQADATMQRLLKRLGARTNATSPAAITLEPLPARIIAGQSLSVGFTVHQKDTDPPLPNTLIVYAQRLGEDSRMVFGAKTDGAYGHYQVTLEFSRGGTWYWLINAERPNGEQPMPILNVLGPDGKQVSAQPAPAANHVNEVSPLLLALGLMGLLFASGALFTWMGKRTRT